MVKLTDYSQPTPLVSQALSDVSPGRALDIGTYEGRNALYLARLGWEVVAIDNDQAPLDVLTEVAKDEGLNITTILTDVRGYKPTGSFDAILSLMVLHFLPEADIAQSISDMQDWTNPGGYNIITAFTADNPPALRPYLFPTDSLRIAYKGWRIESYEEAFTSWIIPEGKTEPERYMAARIVAQRP